MIGLPCITDADCPSATGAAGSASRCRPRGCDGYVCTCDQGYVPSIDMMGCQKGTYVLATLPCQNGTYVVARLRVRKVRLS